MWPRSADWLYTGLDPRLSRYNEDNFQFYLVRMLERITLCMEEHIGLDLDDDKRLLPALLLFNPIEDPLWSDLGSSDGIGFTEHARNTLKDAQELLVNYVELKSTDPERAKKVYEFAVETVSALPRPASTLLNPAIDEGPDKLATTVSHLIEFYTQGLIEARRWRGNARAKKLAVRLRAITEYYTDHPVRVGKDSRIPSGAYVECLYSLFEVIGLQAHFFRYALFAKNIPSNHPELKKSFEALRSL